MILFKVLLVLILGITIGTIGTTITGHSVSRALAICVDKVIKESDKNTDAVVLSNILSYYQLPAKTRVTYGMAEGYFRSKTIQCLLQGSYKK
jgi:hypothetical protein